MTRTVMARKKPLINRPLFLDGIGRGGKFLLGKIVCSLERVEYFQAVTMLEQMPILARLGVITEDAAILQLQLGVDEHAYAMRIGRNINLRSDDASSVFNAPNVSEYQRRSVSPIPPEIAIEIDVARAWSPFLIHEGLPHARLFLKAFPGLRWIAIVRDPFDVAYSWWKRGWGHRLLADPLSYSMLVESNGESVPWYFYEYQEPYGALSAVDRIIRSITMLTELSDRGYDQLESDDRAKVLLVPYEDLVERTHGEVQRMVEFLECAPLPEMAVTLARERCPSPLPPSRRAARIAEMSPETSPALFDSLLCLSEEYARRHPKAAGAGD